MRLTRWIFLKLLALVYLVAFVSLWVQVDGLFGSHGVAPAAQLATAARQQLGVQAWWQFPSLFWLAPSDAGLHALCGLGTLAAGLLLAGVLPVGSAAIAWLCYLSLVSFGSPFLMFQWDMLLLEAGFLAIFLAPLKLLQKGPEKDPLVPMGVVWLFRFLVFRLMFSSGLVKMASGDPTWRDLTAMDYHYWTQPLPPWTAYYVAHLPAGWHHFETLAVLVLELAVPWLVWTGRRGRQVAAGCFAGLMLLIEGTGNFGFFNLLTLALCVLLLDDKVFPARLQPEKEGTGVAWYPKLAAGLMVLIGFLNLPVWLGMVGARPPFSGVYRRLQPFGIVNSYGLFAVMTTRRHEIVLEGSDDGDTWQTYAFRYKPGDPDRRPPFVAPYQPRLDWQMWFAALGTPQGNTWLLSLSRHLLLATPQVLSLLGHNPFPDHPPRYLRARLYDYHFSPSGSSDWWVREPIGFYLPAMELEGGRLRLKE